MTNAIEHKEGEFTAPEAVLVTGCAGFIGSNFVRQFRAAYPSTTVVGIDNFATGRREALDPEVRFYEGSILDRELVSLAMSEHRPAYVFHFAALPRVSYSVEEPVETSEVNIIGTVNILNESRKHGVKRVIYSSSSSVYGGAKHLPTTEADNAPDPKSPYAVQKYVGEPFCKIFAELYGIDTVSLRYFNVFGPGQYGDSPYSTVVSAWLEALYFPNKKQAFIEGDGEQSRDFCYVDNVVAANIAAMRATKPFCGGAFNVAHGERTTVNEVRALIEEYTGKTLQLEQRPPRVGDVRDTHADISKAKTWFGYEPSVNFEEGLRRTVAWFDERVQQDGGAA